MKVNTNLFGLIYKKSNGKFTTVPYLRDVGSVRYMRSLMNLSRKLLKRKTGDVKIVKLTLETIE